MERDNTIRDYDEFKMDIKEPCNTKINTIKKNEKTIKSQETGIIINTEIITFRDDIQPGTELL